MSFVIDGRLVDPPEGLMVKNFVSDGLHHFKNGRRQKPVTELVIHETVTRSAGDTVAVLKQRGLGVQFIVDEFGVVYQHGDALLDEDWHASQHNDFSIGIETVNPYYPDLRPKNSAWTQVINAPWAHKGTYVVPTPVQAEAVCLLTDFFTTADANPVTVPQLWPGFDEATKKMSLGKVPRCAQAPTHGILAHTYFGHMDGPWLVVYCWLRMEAKMSPDEAYAEAVRRCSDVRLADLSDIEVPFPFCS